MPTENSYTPAVRELEYALYEIAGFDGLARLESFKEATPELVRAVLEEAGRFAVNVLAPLNRSGDIQGARLVEGEVITADGWRAAYRDFVAAGWPSMVFDAGCGGQGLPRSLAAAVDELWHGANMAFSLNPMLTRAAANAIFLHGDERQKQLFLPPLVSGAWTGTMNLTEAQAGSDLGAIRCKAVPDGDRYRISGQKIFITYGDHDLSGSIVHMVLARTPDSPPGVKGVSLFIVPKYRVKDDGSLGERNDVRCLSLEHKLGIHASPTCVLSFGEKGGAEGYLVGEKNRGIEYMFTMMNESRLAVGVQGIGIAERAYQKALGYARERIQGRPFGEPGGEAVAIIRHGDVRRMLMTMKSLIEAMRALALCTGAWLDGAEKHENPEEKARARALAELLTPVVKGWCTERSIEIASLAIQVHGGMGYIEESGVCQYLRDARITTIYEGTTGIQANDLVGRKLIRNGGEYARILLDAMRETRSELESSDLTEFAERLDEGIEALDRATQWLLAQRLAPRLAAAAAVRYLNLAGDVAGGWMMAKSALAAGRKLAAGGEKGDFYRAKLATARFYFEQILPEAGYLADIVTLGSEAVYLLDEASF